MPVYPAGQTVDRPYHRLRPVSSSPKAATEAERLESLRRNACSRKADAVIEAASEDTRLKDGGYATRASGTAIRWKTPTQPSGSTPASATTPAASGGGSTGGATGEAAKQPAAAPAPTPDAQKTPSKSN